MPVPTFVQEAVEAHVRAYGLTDGDYLWAWRAGAPYGHQRFREAFDEAVRRAGLDQVRPKVTTHKCRHTYASWLIDSGASVTELARRLGDTEAVVLSTYSHLMPSSADRTRRALDAAWGMGPKAAVAPMLHAAPNLGG